MVEEAMQAAIDELNKRQATIDALVAALEDAWVYVPENARGTQTKIKAALALARKGV